MAAYYEVIASINNAKSEILYGSFKREDCTNEIEAERQNWRLDGYRNIKIVSRETNDKPDRKVYANK